MKEGEDRLDDISDAAALRRLEARRDSVARMKAQFDRAQALARPARPITTSGRSSFERAELQYKYRRYPPPFYSFLYSVHAQLPNFLINTHTVDGRGAT